MASGKARKWGIAALAVLTFVLVGSAVGFRAAVGSLKAGVVEALGPGSEIREIRVGWKGVEIHGLRIKGTGGWPSDDTLSAESVTLVPSIRSLLSGEYRVSSITLEKPYLSIHRTRAGKILVVPSLLKKKESGDDSSGNGAKPSVKIGRISLNEGVVELFDDTVARPGCKIRIEQIHAVVQEVNAPGFTGRSSFDIKGVVKGSKADGQASLRGWAEISTKDSSVELKLKSVDLATFQPYLTKAKDTRVSGGILDLDVQSDVRSNRLNAPGTIAIADLKFAAGSGIWGSFMGVPRTAVLAMLKDKGNKITVSFVLEGDIDNPKFSLNETLSTRLALSMADTLKVGIGGLAEGAGAIGQKGVEAAGSVVKGVGSAVGDLFRGAK